ncbi:MAG: C40 family peptidase [Mariniphaga sp.]|nr:C40 family peptidase [Mariniphaga sp.]
MRYGISNLSIVPVRSEPREKSEMCTQILFGEHYTIIEENAKWCQVKLAFDGYEGWIDRKMVNEIDEQDFLELEEIPRIVTTDVFNIVQPAGDYSNFLIVAGSSLPHFDRVAHTFKIGKVAYSIQGNSIASPPNEVRVVIIENALKYFNAPYLWGGRSPFGIDCSGFSQILYKMAGLTIPRDAVQQAMLGENLTFVEEALPGDLAFFDNEEGAIIHVGIIWEKNKIIHSSGKVRIDNVDHFGIFNIDTGRYTHQMRLMRRLIND